LRFIVVALFFLINLYGQSDSELLTRAQKYLKSASKTDQVRAYNDYKNLYLRAIMDDNYELRLSALDGIVKSGNKLKIDVEKYENELKNAATNKKVVQKVVPKVEETPKQAVVLKELPKKELPKKIAEEPKKILASATETSYTTSRAQEIEAPKKSNKKKIQVTSSHKLKSIRWQESRLLLNFDKELTQNQVNYFTLHEPKKSRYRYIFDIHASMLSKAQNLRKSNIDKIKIAQFDQDTLRLVIENSQKIDVSFKRDGSSLVINTALNEKRPTVSAPATIATSRDIQPRRKAIDRHKVIVIDPGHGGKDPGAVGYKKYREKVVVLDISKKLKAILESRGYRVYLTRDRDKFLTLRERSIYANKRHADLFVSIHANAVEKKNAHKAYGIECYFLDKSRSNRAKNVAAKENSADLSGLNFYAKESFLNTLSSHNIIASNKLAIDLQGNMLKILRKSYRDIKDGGVRPAPFWVLVGAQMPAVLVEVGFISHSMEAERLVNRSYQEKLALGLANGIENYFINN